MKSWLNKAISMKRNEAISQNKGGFLSHKTAPLLWTSLAQLSLEISTRNPFPLTPYIEASQTSGFFFVEASLFVSNFPSSVGGEILLLIFSSKGRKMAFVTLQKSHHSLSWPTEVTLYVIKSSSIPVALLRLYNISVLLFGSRNNSVWYLLSLLTGTKQKKLL